VPQARLILLLRDPVDRAHSNWTHLWNAGLEPEADFLAACRAEPERIAAGWAQFWHYAGLGLLRAADRAPVPGVPARAGAAAALPRPEGRAGRHADQVCEFLGVRTGVLRAIPRENVNRHVVEDSAVNRMLRGLLRAGGHFGHRFPCRCDWRPAARCSPSCTASAAAAGHHTAGACRAACRCSPMT
jgi:hypothetical protein